MKVALSILTVDFSDFNNKTKDYFNEADYIRLKDYYILTLEKLKNAKSDLSIMHPLPRVNEIATDVDDDKRACYFKQARYGVYIRMALILMLLEVK